MIVLNEFDLVTYCLVEVAAVVAFHEEAALILEDLRFEDQYFW